MNNIQQFVWGRPLKSKGAEIKNYERLYMKIGYLNDYSKPNYQKMYNATNQYSYHNLPEFPFEFIRESTDFVEYTCDVRIDQNWIGADFISSGDLMAEDKFKGLEYFAYGSIISDFMFLIEPDNTDNVVKFDRIRFLDTRQHQIITERDYNPQSGILYSNLETISALQIFDVKHTRPFAMTTPEYSAYGYGYPFMENMPDEAIFSGEFCFQFVESATANTSKKIIMRLVAQFEHRPN